MDLVAPISPSHQSGQSQQQLTSQTQVQDHLRGGSISLTNYNQLSRQVTQGGRGLALVTQDMHQKVKKASDAFTTDMIGNMKLVTTRFKSLSMADVNSSKGDDFSQWMTKVGTINDMLHKAYGQLLTQLQKTHGVQSDAEVKTVNTLFERVEKLQSIIFSQFKEVREHENHQYDLWAKTLNTQMELWDKQVDIQEKIQDGHLRRTLENTRTQNDIDQSNQRLEHDLNTDKQQQSHNQGMDLRRQEHQETTDRENQQIKREQITVDAELNRLRIGNQRELDNLEMMLKRAQLDKKYDLKQAKQRLAMLDKQQSRAFQREMEILRRQERERKNRKNWFQRLAEGTARVIKILL